MIQKLTAAFLLWMMSMTVVMAQPGLRYCLCVNEIFLGDCKCSETSDPEPAPSSCCSHCGECASHATPTTKLQICSNPGDCTVDLFMDLGDYSSPSPPDLQSSPDKFLKSPPYLPATSLVPSKIFRDAAHHVRGPPPPSHSIRLVPLFLSHSVFLL